MLGVWGLDKHIIYSDHGQTTSSEMDITLSEEERLLSGDGPYPPVQEKKAVSINQRCCGTFGMSSDLIMF